MPNQQAEQVMADPFTQHMGAELAGDLETTMARMTDNPYLINVPALPGPRKPV